METREKLSVIIPMYNAGRYLAECAASVRAQNWPGELEIIAVDDGSADNSASLAEELGLKGVEGARPATPVSPRLTGSSYSFTTPTTCWRTAPSRPCTPSSPRTRSWRHR